MNREDILQSQVNQLQTEVSYWKGLVKEHEETIEVMKKQQYTLALSNLETKQQHIRLMGK